MVVMNIYSNTGKFNNTTNANISHTYQTSFTPADAAFSIWGVIFAALGVYTVYQALPQFRIPGGFVHKIGLVMALNFIANGCWGVAFDYDLIWLSVLIIFFLLLTLIYTYTILGIGDKGGVFPLTGYIRWYFFPQTERTTVLFPEDKIATLSMFWCLYFPVSLYLAWIFVATIANISVACVKYAPEFLADHLAVTWSVVMQVIASVVALIMIIGAMDVTFSSVIVWTLFWLYQGQESPAIQSTAWNLIKVVGSVTLVAIAWRLWKFGRWNEQKLGAFRTAPNQPVANQPLGVGSQTKETYKTK